MSPCVDLAEPLRIRDFAGSLGEWIDLLEWQYLAIVRDPGVRLWGVPVRSDGGKAADGRDSLFWHLVTRSTPAHTEEARELDIMRASLLPQVWDLLDRLAAGDPRACWWHSRDARYRGSTLHVASVDFGLHVVLKPVAGAFVLRTAHPVTHAGQRSRLMDKASRAWQAGDSRRDDFRHAVWRRRAPAYPWPTARHAEEWWELD